MQQGQQGVDTMHARRRRTRMRVLVGASAATAVTVVLAGCTSAHTTTTATSSAAGDASSNAPSIASSTAAPTPTPTAKAPALAAVITTSAGHADISPSTPVSVSIAHGTLTSVVLTNAEGRKVSGELAAGSASWRSTEDLGYSKTYKLSATGKNADGKMVTKSEKVTTLTPHNMTMPYIDDVYGNSVTGGTTYGVGMIVRVNFDENVDRAAAQRTLSVTTTPKTTGGWYWDSSDHQNAYWRPASYYKPGTKVTITAKAYGKKVGDGLYGQADKSVSFVIGAKHVAIADAATHHVKVYFDDKLVRNMPTSMGRGGTLVGDHGQPIYLWTMPGNYTVINHENPAIMSSGSYGLPVANGGYGKLRIPFGTKISTDGIYLHQLDSTVWAQGHSNRSHGCLNLNFTNAKWYYNTSRIGDVVQVVHSGGPKLQFWQGGQWQLSWAQWQKGSAL